MNNQVFQEIVITCNERGRAELMPARADIEVGLLLSVHLQHVEFLKSLAKFW